MSATRPTCRGGFTLLEVVLAITLAVLLAGVMFATYHGGMAARDRVYREMDALLGERLVMDRITQDLRGAMVVELLQVGMEGQADQAAWAAVQTIGLGAWVDPEGLADPRLPATDVQWVTYRLRITTNDDGEEVVEGLERVVQKVLNVSTVIDMSETDDGSSLSAYAETVDEDEEEDEELLESMLLTTSLKHIAFRYFDGSAWQETWNQAALPRAVEITLGDLPLDPETDASEYPGRLFRRVVFLPGSMAPEGGTVRGLEETR